MSPAVSIARRELRAGLRGFRVFLACLILGVAAIAAVGSVREAILEGLASEGARLLGGDAQAQFTYRFADPGERRALDAEGDVSEIVEFRSMAVFGEDRALTEVKGVDAAYPLYGEVRLDPPMPLADALAGNGAAMAPILMDRLGMRIGDTFRLGTNDYTLRAAIDLEPDNTAAGFDFGPRTLVRTEALGGAGLIQPGTLYETEYRLRIPPDTDLDALQARLDTTLADSGYRWRDRRNGAPGIAQFVDRLSAFLVLVGLAGLAVGGVGVATAVRAQMAAKIATIATLKTLGAATGTIFAAYAMVIGAMTLLAVVIGLALGAALPLAFAPILSDRLPVPAAFTLYPGALAEAALYGLLAAALFTLWPLARARDIRAAELFRGAAGRLPPGLPKPIFITLGAAILAVLVGTAAALSGLPWLTLYTAAGLAAAFAALLGAATALRRAASALAHRARGRPALRFALGAVGGPASEAAPVVLSLGLGLTVLAAVGQIDVNLRGAIEQDLPDVAPAYFMVDIQPDQVAGFREILAEDPGVTDVEMAPMLRGVITGINGQPATDVAGEHWTLSGDRGVTYSAVPPEGTTITAGEWWPADYTGPNLISFAAEEAAELGLTLGDTLTVNILGRDIEGRIASFREVDFSTAGIGFILAMNPAALEGAPHTWIATIYAEPASEARILRDIAGPYPNITAIRVRDAIDRVSTILDGVAAAVTYGASITLVTGAVVLLGAAAAGTQSRIYEASVLKTLGAARSTILISFAIRWAIMGAAAGTIAAIAGALAGWGIATFVMETTYRFAPLSALLIVAGGIGGTLIAGLTYAWTPLAARPAQVLRRQE